MRLKIRKEARRDITAGARFYRNQNPPIGEYFITSIRADLEDLKWQAGIHAKLYGYHCKRAKKFPFGIYYSVENNLAEVVAILDLRGDPLAIQRQIGVRSEPN